MICRAAKWSAVLAAAAIAGTAWGQSSTGTVVNPPAAAYTSPAATVVVPASGSNVVVVPDWSACNRLSGMARAQCLRDARGVSPMDSFGMQVASGKNAGYGGAADHTPGRSAASEGGSSGSGSSGGGH